MPISRGQSERYVSSSDNFELDLNKIKAEVEKDSHYQPDLCPGPKSDKREKLTVEGFKARCK
jgi:hypothetical protein